MCINNGPKKVYSYILFLWTRCPRPSEQLSVFAGKSDKD